MSTFADRQQTALVVIDVQNAVVQPAFERDRVVATIADVVDAARKAGTPVVWVQHNEPQLPIDSSEWQIVPELSPLPDEPRVNKQFASSFEATNLDDVLDRLSAGALVLCGAETNFCVRHTLHAALERGYDVTLVGDAHTALDTAGPHGPIPASSIIDELNMSVGGYQLPDRRCDVVTAAEASESF